MIIATIGRAQYALENIQEAETLLRILGKAQPVESTFIMEAGNISAQHVYHQTHSAPEIEMVITQQPSIFTHEEMQMINKEDEHKREQAKAAREARSAARQA